MHDINRPYEDIANAVVMQAVTDYRNALNGVGYGSIPADSVIVELEKFFHSTWYQTLTRVKGDYLIERLKKEHQAKQEKEQLCESH
jgi:hypothetical protein